LAFSAIIGIVVASNPLSANSRSEAEKIAFCFVGVDSTLSPLSKNGMNVHSATVTSIKNCILIVKR